mmetsp:Transcript_18203/g.33448  ORF Transcript_18203/g.33448 Transcript_18203/m.33448 type:complete len:455 (-) Transcript_18203:85-1449(-)
MAGIAVPPGYPPLPAEKPCLSAPQGAAPASETPEESLVSQATFSFALLLDRFKDLGLEAPTNIKEEAQLSALVSEAERLNGQGVQQPSSKAWQEPSANLADAPVGRQRAGDDGVERHVGYLGEAFRDGSIFTFTTKGPADLESTFSCTRGTHGVTSLSLAAGADASLLSSETLEATQSAPGAMRGSGFTWVRGETLGRGSLGRVFKALDQATGNVMAVKEVLLNTDQESDAKLRLALQNEVNLLKDLKHPHIVSYLGHDYIDNCLYMYLEYMPGGSMAQVLGTFGPFEEVLIAAYTRQLADGLVYLHTRDPPVVHRDVKGGNILVGLDGRVKLADFGCSKRAQETMSQTMRGSVPWMAPEVIAHTCYGRAADIWSFGCVLIEMGTARVPWGNFDNQLAAMVKIGMSKETPSLPTGISPSCQDFIRRCVQRDKTLRPSATDMLSLDFIRDVPLPE